MKRRKFLGFMGGAAVAGPAMANQTLESLSVPGVANSTSGLVSAGTALSEANAIDRGHSIKWAKDAIKHIMGLSDQEKQKRIRETYISTLDPNAAALRSVNLQTKVHITRTSQYENSTRRDLAHWWGIVKGE